MSDAQSVVLGLGEWRVTGDPDLTLVCLGLGSCVGLCIYDPIAGVAGMAHMVLPKSSGDVSTGKAAKFVDLAVPLLLYEIQKLGGAHSRLKIALVGGSSMMSLTAGARDVLKIGERNAEAAQEALKAAGLRAKDCELGGTRGRTVRLEAGTGRLEIVPAGAPGYELWAAGRNPKLLEV